MVVFDYIQLKEDTHRKLLTDIGFLVMDQIALVEEKMPKIIEEIKQTPANEKIILFTKTILKKNTWT